MLSITIPKPAWLKKKYSFPEIRGMKSTLRSHNLHTVCEEAHCPNISECFGRGVATVMIMGDICTRACKFCAVVTGRPHRLDSEEPLKVALWAAQSGLKHLVITSVDRDDLSDQGSRHFANTVSKVLELNAHIRVEVLTPDFCGREEFIDLVCQAGPHIYNHNLETVERLTPIVRSVAKYRRSLSVLQHVKSHYPELTTKSGLMLGLGEEEEEVLKTMDDLLHHGCDLLTIGQYLQPTQKHSRVVEYIRPEKFDAYKKIGEQMGFRAVFSGPFVRSSYMADHYDPFSTNQ